VTINEPEIYAAASYLGREWPPYKRNFFSFFSVIRNLIKAHREAYRIIKKLQPAVQVGIATNNGYYESSGDPLSILLKNLVEHLDHFYILDRIKDCQDFIGLNYYFHTRVRGFQFSFQSGQSDGSKVSDLGWEIFPEGIYHVLKKLKKYNLPIYITENGVADSKDRLRQDFIKEHLIWIYKAINDGVDVRGYLYWSLMDNFEWAKGFEPRFGLIHVDYETFERKPRPSANFYAEICRKNQLEP
jgi:beta-glucosidase